MLQNTVGHARIKIKGKPVAVKYIVFIADLRVFTKMMLNIYI